MTGQLMTVGDDGGHRGQQSPVMPMEDWSVLLHTDGEQHQWGIEDLRGLPRTELREVDITCVSSGKIYRPSGARATFGGIAFTDLIPTLKTAQTVRFVSHAPGSCGPLVERHDTALEYDFCTQMGKVLLALTMNGEPLPYQNGGPVRIIALERFFYKSLKWLGEIHLLPEPLENCRGTWERYAGYHNVARIAHDERFEPFLKVADAQLLPRPVADPRLAFLEMLERGDISRLVAAKLHLLIPDFAELPGWNQRLRLTSGSHQAALRGTDFSGRSFRGWTNLAGANFSLSRFVNCDLSGADLNGCDLEGAIFWGADLSDASMRGAYLGGAEFRKASGGMAANVEGLDVTNAQGLTPEMESWLQEKGATLGDGSL